MKHITVWETRLPGGEWEHNHIEDGWSERSMPRAINEAQAKVWMRKEWLRTHKLLDDDNRVVTADQPSVPK